VCNDVEMKMTTGKSDIEKAAEFGRIVSEGIKKLKTHEEWLAFYTAAVEGLQSQIGELGPEHPKQFRRAKMLLRSLEGLTYSVQPASAPKPSG
jgi:hypothetical protein